MADSGLVNTNAVIEAAEEDTGVTAAARSVLQLVLTVLATVVLIRALHVLLHTYVQSPPRGRWLHALQESLPTSAQGSYTYVFLFCLSLPAAVIAQTEDDQLYLLDLLMFLAVGPLVLHKLGLSDGELLDGVSNKPLEIGKASAYSHYYGYLRFMRGENRCRDRLRRFREENDLGEYCSDRLFVLLPFEASQPYPSKLTELRGVERQQTTMTPFKVTVGGNTRTYGGFGLYQLQGGGVVALDTIGARNTLQHLRRHGPAGFSEQDFSRQLLQFTDELENIINQPENVELREDIVLIRYKVDDNVADLIRLYLPQNL